MHYLVNWRMQVATQKLRDTSASLAQVAETVGYDSEAAFSRAFKKAFGAPPATWRRLNSQRIQSVPQGLSITKRHEPSV
jgi:transcriptional regulator GlxA family with amidase domain